MEDAERNTGLILGAPRDGWIWRGHFFLLFLLFFFWLRRGVLFGLGLNSESGCRNGRAERVALLRFDIIVGVLPIAFSRTLAAFLIPQIERGARWGWQRGDKSLSHFRRRIHRHCLCIEQAGVKGS